MDWEKNAFVFSRDVRYSRKESWTSTNGKKETCYKWIFSSVSALCKAISQRGFVAKQVSISAASCLTTTSINYICAPLSQGTSVMFCGSSSVLKREDHCTSLTSLIFRSPATLESVLRGPAEGRSMPLLIRTLRGLRIHIYSFFRVWILERCCTCITSVSFRSNLDTIDQSLHQYYPRTSVTPHCTHLSLHRDILSSLICRLHLPLLFNATPFPQTLYP